MADSLGLQFEAGSFRQVPLETAWTAHPAASDAAEWALIHSLVAGEETAYETLIQRFEHPVYNLVARLTDDAEASPDIVQEVFLKIFRSVGGFRGDCSLKTWVYRIAVNEVRNHKRWFARHRKQEVALDPLQDEPACTWLTDRGQSPHDSAAENERLAMIEQALNQVNPVYRAALILREVEDLSYEEIGQILEISLGTVKSRIVRGREELRERLATRLSTSTARPNWSQEVLAK